MRVSSGARRISGLGHRPVVFLLRVTLSCDSICLVDDNTSVLRALTRLLKTVGVATQAFSSPKQFVEYAKSHPVPVVVLDINMPEMTGLEVFESLRATKPQSRVIFITGTDNPSARATALAQGALAVFAKPCMDDTFVATILSALAGAAEE